jgi:hypothetical protein
MGGAGKVMDSYRLVHGAGHESLRRRTGDDDVRHACRARAVGGERSRRRIRSRRRASPTVKVERTRPLCPYPQVATYKGSGSTDEAQISCVNRVEGIRNQESEESGTANLNPESDPDSCFSPLSAARRCRSPDARQVRVRLQLQSQVSRTASNIVGPSSIGADGGWSSPRPAS